MDSMKTIIIIPAYNVEHEIGSVLEYLPKEKVLVINDGSTDGTESVIRDSCINSIHVQENKGVGNALKLGISYGLKNNFTHAITIDADGQHDPSLWSKFEDELHYSDFVIGNRFHRITDIPDQKISSNFFASVLVYQIFGEKIFDISCGYRAFNLNRFKKNYNSYSNSYGFLYDSLFDNINTLGSVKIPCIYGFSELLSTRTSELLGFLMGLKKFTTGNVHDDLVVSLLSAAKSKKDLHCSILNYDISAFYLAESDSYIFQTNKIKLKDYYE
jgi:glycosyltransferase involved in cell wall biosynthesis